MPRVKRVKRPCAWETLARRLEAELSEARCELRRVYNLLRQVDDGRIDV